MGIFSKFISILLGSIAMVACLIILVGMVAKSSPQVAARFKCKVLKKQEFCGAISPAVNPQPTVNTN